MRVQGDTARLMPLLQPFPGACSAPALHLPALEPSLRGLPGPLGSVPWRRGAVRRFPVPAEASLGRCGAFLFVLSLVTRIGI